jgi:tRNA-splicing ligase RtcB
MFIELAKQDALRSNMILPDRDLAYFEEGARHFGDYVRALSWAQSFAALNRPVMMKRVIDAAQAVIHKNFHSTIEAVSCHHNYVQQEHHFGECVYVTRQVALRAGAGAGQLGIVPGNMGVCSYIVRGKGNAESFESCSHGAGRVMSRGKAKRRFTLADHRAATEGAECRKDKGVIDETPAAHKDIEAVVQAQRELVDVVHTLKQVVCVKGTCGVRFFLAHHTRSLGGRLPPRLPGSQAPRLRGAQAGAGSLALAVTQGRQSLCRPPVGASMPSDWSAAR